jgi:thiol-disulfide isomerase/thioredoxin
MVRLEALEKKAGVDPNAIEVEGLPIGADAPALRLASLDGRTITSETLEERGLPIILVFTELGCGACDALLPEVAQWQKEYQSRLEIVPISGGALDANLAKSAKHGLKNLLLQAGRETAEAYKVNGTPSAVVIAEGKIGAPLAAGADAIRELVARNTLPPPAKKGDRVPELKLKNLEGATIDLASLRGRRSLVLFWSPSCGFCQQMLDEVKRWERNPPRNAPDLVIVSSGTAEVNRQQGFRSTVLLDPIFGAGNVLGAGGTPSAVVIDEEGRVASEVGVGAASVMELAGSEN